MGDGELGFVGEGWTGRNPLTVDPGLLWLAATGINDRAYGLDVATNGRVVVAGETGTLNYPATPGAFRTTWNGNIGDPARPPGSGCWPRCNRRSIEVMGR